MNNGLDVYFVDLPSKDPNELGFEKTKEILETTPQMSQEYLMEQTILCRL